MNRIVVYENSYVEIDNQENLLVDLIDMGIHIKQNLGLINNPIQLVAPKRLYVGSIVGNITLNDTNLIISPKVLLGSENADAQIKVLYMRTLKCARNELSSVLYFCHNNSIADDNVFFDVLSSYFIDSTKKAIQKSKINLYKDAIEKVRTIKGRILVQKQLSSPMLDEKVWCKYKKLTSNNIYNQLLYWTCKYLSNLTKNFDLKRQLLSLSREFEQSTDLLNKKNVRQIKVPRQYSEYEEAISIAIRLYLEDKSRIENLEKSGRLCGYVINMERSFENIVCYFSNRAAQVLHIHHKPQASKNLARSAKTSDTYEVRPDDLFSFQNNNLIVDAKYKSLLEQEAINRKPSREDFYQMLGTCIAYDCSEAILIYPKTNSFPENVWTLDNEVNEKRISICSACINIIDTDEGIIEALEAIIKNTDFYKEIVNG